MNRRFGQGSAEYFQAAGKNPFFKGLRVSSPQLAQFWAFTIVLAFACTAANALLPNAAGPRPGPISIVKVDVSGPESLPFLVRNNYDVSAVHGATATVYAIAAELRELDQNGIVYRMAGAEPADEKALTGYHTYDSLTTELQNLASAYPAICRLSSVGKSVQGRDLWACLITHEPDLKQDKPAVKYVSTIHGDEPVGMEMCMDLINLLLSGDGNDTRITALLENESVWIVPLMNPDGLTLNQRYNANGYDLNRSFPQYATDFTNTVFDGPPSTAGRELEVAAVMNWTAGHTFVVSANFHTGSLVVNYPYDFVPGVASGIYTACPDDALFQNISRRYSVNNPPMWNSTEFTDGITNGNAWYIVTGGMQDWNYRYATCNEVTIELNDTVKAPAASTLPTFWSNNEIAMLAYLESAQIGIRGLVTDSRTGNPVRAEIGIEGNAQPVVSDPDIGNYHRMLLPGTYTLNVSAPGYVSRQIGNVLVADGAATRVDIALVELDTTPPTGTIVINGNRSTTNSRNVTLSLSWDDGADGSGVIRMRFSDDGAHWTAWEPLAATRAHTLPTGDGHKTVRVQYLDRMNNRSAAFNDYILLDTTPPTGTIIINNGASTTATPAVTLGLTWSDGTGAGAMRMRFSNDGAHWSAWESLTATRPYVLPEGQGYHTVRVQYLDGANNYSAAFSDYIKLVTQ